MHVACHELMGHGAGKMFYKNKDGSFNFDSATVKNLLTNEEITTWYEEGETWNGKFGDISASIEECRADICGFWLMDFKEVFETFGFTDADRVTNFWVSVMAQLRKGILGLPLFSPESNKWGQAHTQGAFVYAMYLYKNQKTGFLRFDLNEDKTNFTIHLDRDLLYTEGRELTKSILQMIQTYKSVADVEGARHFYSQYSAVDEEFITLRNIVLAKRQPRRIVGSHNLFLGDETVVFKTYETNHIGVIRSFQDRFETSREFVENYISEWEKTAADIRV